MTIAIVVLVACVLAASIPLLSARSPRARATALDSYARRVGLELVPEIEPRVEARLRRRERSVVLGAAIAGVTGLVIAALAPAPGGALAGLSYEPLLIIVLAWCGYVIGAAAASLSETFDRDQDSPRIARAIQPQVHHYLSDAGRWTGRIALALALVVYSAALIVVATNFGGIFDGMLGTYLLGPATVSMLLALVLLVLAEVMTTRIVRHPQPASTSTELAWDDALKSLALRDVRSVPLLLGFVATLLPLGVLGALATGHGPGSLGNVLVGLAGGGFIALSLAYGVLALVSWSGKPDQRYWRQLWAPRSEAATGGAAS